MPSAHASIAGQSRKSPDGNACFAAGMSPMNRSISPTGFAFASQRPPLLRDESSISVPPVSGF